ncbi:MAG: hypothetical protein JO019_04680 [Candidatus Kaiserbacteria bacterium]|nr:hypothetical protein [Candidatus Kaiserbacteria bacterium]
MAKYVVGVIAFILVVAGGYWLLKGKSAAPSQDMTGSTTTTTMPQQAATSTYATSTFSVVYPNDFTVDPNYTYTQVNPAKPIAGVKFTIPMTMATGTNLSSDTYVSVEQLPHAKNCTGDIYLHDNVKAVSMSDNGVTYSVASTTGAGAGNFYEEWVYAISGSSPCTAVRYFIHSGNIGNYPPGTVTEFNKDALTAAFDSIRRSLTLTH